MSKELIIIGASGFAMEVYWLANRAGRQVLGFLDDNIHNHNKKILGRKILGAVDSWKEYPNCEFIVAVGNPRTRRIIVDKLKAMGSPNFATLIDPSAIVDEGYVSIGEGSVICAGVVCTVDISIGEHVIINLNSTIGHEVNVEDFCTIAPLVAVSGNVILKECVEVGTGAAVRQGVELGSGSMLGMGGVLTKSVEENSIVIGNPARFLKKFPE